MADLEASAESTYGLYKQTSKSVQRARIVFSKNKSLEMIELILFFKFL